MPAIDPNAPAFGSNAQKAEDVFPVEQAAAQPTDNDDSEEASDEPARVKYSRYEKKHREALEARREADYWREQAETRSSVREPAIDPQDEAYKLWIENYGDNEASRKAWKNQLRINDSLSERALSRAREEALEAIREERYEEVARTEQNVEVLDDSFDELADEIGRDLNAREQSALLDIIDDYTPKDRDGNYAGPIISMDKAWKIYSMENQSSRSGTVSSRNSVASLSGTRSQGDTTINEKDKNFNPSWGAMRNPLS